MTLYADNHIKQINVHTYKEHHKMFTFTHGQVIIYVV